MLTILPSRPSPMRSCLAGSFDASGHPQLAEGEVVTHRLTKMLPGDPEVLLLDVIEARQARPGAAWQTRATPNGRGIP